MHCAFLSYHAATLVILAAFLGASVANVPPDPIDAPIDDPAHLFPDQNIDTPVLPGEGLLTESILSLPRTGNGLIYHAIHKQPNGPVPSRYVMECLRSAVRMKQYSSPGSTLQFLLYVNRPVWEHMSNKHLCSDDKPGCQEFRQHKDVFHFVRFYEDYSYPAIRARRENFQGWPDLWLKRIIGTLHSPFANTLNVDSDVHACKNFEQLFDLMEHKIDVVSTIAPSPFSSSTGRRMPLREDLPALYAYFPERNLGMQLLATSRPNVLKLVALFRDAYVRQANTTTDRKLWNDQSGFREALFTLRHTVREHIMPDNVVCRHALGCPDGCLLVHRKLAPDMSYGEFLRQRNVKKQSKKAGAP
eukprot:m.16650 g.16650  ORF g.16650 m.16650 type:complete len:359 (-) comp28546_c0_seq1:104-1180(-)